MKTKRAYTFATAHEWHDDELVELGDRTWDIRPARPRVDVVEWPETRRPQGVMMRNRAEVSAKFAELHGLWRSQTKYLSSPTQKAMNPAYQQIIALGPLVIPDIIDALRQRADHWFWALVALVGEDHAFGATTLPEASRLWIEWYEQAS